MKLRETCGNLETLVEHVALTALNVRRLDAPSVTKIKNFEPWTCFYAFQSLGLLPRGQRILNSSFMSVLVVIDKRKVSSRGLQEASTESVSNSRAKISATIASQQPLAAILALTMALLFDIVLRLPCKERGICMLDSSSSELAATQ
ncbi:hypothetical protein KCU95_g49, partial [Aureobasidium melanogenum]